MTMNILFVHLISYYYVTTHKETIYIIFYIAGAYGVEKVVVLIFQETL